MLHKASLSYDLVQTSYQVTYHLLVDDRSSCLSHLLYLHEISLSILTTSSPWYIFCNTTSIYIWQFLSGGETIHRDNGYHETYTCLEIEYQLDIERCWSTNYRVKRRCKEEYVKGHETLTYTALLGCLLRQVLFSSSHH